MIFFFRRRTILVEGTIVPSRNFGIRELTAENMEGTENREREVTGESPRTPCASRARDSDGEEEGPG
jgi:hypothetical protein